MRMFLALTFFVPIVVTRMVANAAEAASYAAKVEYRALKRILKGRSV